MRCAGQILNSPIPRGPDSLRLGLVDGHVTATEVRAVKALDGGIGLRVVVHLHKSEATRLTGESVADQIDFRYIAKGGKGLAQLGLCNAEWKVAYIQFQSYQCSRKILCLKKLVLSK